MVLLKESDFFKDNYKHFYSSPIYLISSNIIIYNVIILLYLLTGRVQVVKGIEDIQFPHLFITEESNVTFLFALLSVDTLLQSDFKT